MKLTKLQKELVKKIGGDARCARTLARDCAVFVGEARGALDSLAAMGVVVALGPWDQRLYYLPSKGIPSNYCPTHWGGGKWHTEGGRMMSEIAHPGISRAGKVL